ncbi:hypothetical protein DFJ73DRAFT_661754 [Zopfochytrium polystomum]|nr:hypothetical protein DFJ73DRAFT_661754 [Zopfochytrium polystomum]
MVVFAVSFYIVSSIVMVMVNKAVLNSVPLPITFLWLQLLVAVVLIRVSALLGWVRLPLASWKACRETLPLIVVNVVGLTLNTLCLEHVEASFFQIARSMVLPFTVLLSRYFLRDRISPAILLSCGTVLAGFLIGSLFDSGAGGGRITSSTTAPLGVLLGVASSLSTAVHAVVIKKSLFAVKGSVMDLVYYNNLLSAALLLPVLAACGELAQVRELALAAIAGAAETADRAALRQQLAALLVGGLVTGFFGFLINIAGFLQIKVTSPVTHMISSAFRGVLQTGVAVWVFNDFVSTPRALSIALTLSGSAAYAWVRSSEARAAGEMDAVAPAAPPPQTGAAAKTEQQRRRFGFGGGGGGGGGGSWGRVPADRDVEKGAG